MRFDPKKKYYYSRNFSFAPQKKQKRFSFLLLGFDLKVGFLRNFLNFSWRFIFVFYIFIHLLLGQSPFTMIAKYIKANNDDTRVINLYATNSRISYSEDGVGWEGKDNVHFSPSLSEEASEEEFSKDNSAVYSGGDQIIVLSDFWFLENDLENIQSSIANDPLDINIASSTEDDMEEDETEDNNEDNNTASSTEEMELASSSDDILIATNTSEEIIEISSTTENVIEEMEVGISTQEIIDIASSSEKIVIIATSTEEMMSSSSSIEIIEEDEDHEQAVEIIDLEQASTTVEIKEETATSTIEGFSLNDLFGYKEAEAQEYVSTDIESLSELGTLEEATIFLSLAIRQDRKYGEVILDSESSDDDLIETTTTVSEAIIIDEADGGAATSSEENVEIATTSIEVDVAELEEASTTVVEIIEDNTATTTAKNWLSDFINIPEALAQNQLLENASLALWYSLGDDSSSTDGQVWHLLDVIDENNISNYSNDGYLSFDAFFLESFFDIENLEIKVEGLLPDGTALSVYLDSLWIEAVYDEETELDLIKKRERWETALELLSESLVFEANEAGELEFRYNKSEELIWDTLKEIMGIGNFWEDVDIEATLFDKDGEKVDLPLTIVFEEDGQFTIKLPELPRQFTPGKYTIKFYIVDNSGEETEEFEKSQDFSWGVLAINTNKSIYDITGSGEAEAAYLQMAFLSDQGNTICNGDLSLEIIAPDGSVEILSTDNGGITVNPECGPNNVIKTPDYYAYYKIEDTGIYNMKLIASSSEGAKTINDQFEAREAIAFDVERIGPTRIYPWASYDMQLNITAKTDFSGELVEYAPNGFKLLKQNIMIKDQESGEFVDYNSIQATSSDQATFVMDNNEAEKIYKWQNVNLLEGDELRIIYTFDAPKVSPEFYLLGPFGFIDKNDNLLFEEARQWQIASDAEVGAVISETISVTSTSNTSSWTDAVTVSSTNFVGGETYFIYVTAGVGANTTSNHANVKVDYGTSEQFSGLVEPCGTAYDSNQISWFDVYEQPSTPQDIVLRYQPDTGTVYILNAQIMAISLSDLETTDWAYDVLDSTDQHTTTFTDKASVTLSDADGQKDWLVMAMEEVIIDSTSVNYDGRIYDGSNYYMTQTREGEDTAEILSYVLYRSFADVTQNTAYSIQVRDDATGVNDHQKSRVFALNLDAFESHKIYYEDINTGLNTTPSWTTVGNLNSGGNYAPQTTGDQIILASFINDVASYDNGTDDRLQVNGTTIPTNWSWVQTPILSRTAYDSTDEIAQNIVAKTSIPDTGYTISLDALRVVYDTQIADEVSMTVFSVKKVNALPSGNFVSATQKSNGSGIVDIAIEVEDDDYSDSRAKIEVATGTVCDFSSVIDPTLDETDANITADYGDPDIDNDYEYQVGTTSAWIVTSSGLNTVNFDWLSQSDLPTADGDYCLQLTVNNGTFDQAVPATTTLTIDNTLPTAPGPLVFSARTGTTITLDLGATTTESHFREYKIFYKLFDGTDPNENNSVWASSSDLNLADILFNGAATSTVTGLTASSTYSFALWVYDEYGNKASSSRIDIVTNDAPTGLFNSVAQKTNGSGIVDFSIEVDDANNQDLLRAKIDYVFGTTCDFTSPLDPSLDESVSSFSVDFGATVIENDNEYQIGAPGYWLLTAPGSNTVQFDWLSYLDLPDTDGQYCVRLAVNDSFDDQLTSATAVITVDNKTPTSTGALAVGLTTTDSVTLILDTSTPGEDSNEPTVNAYKIFYKQGTSGVNESDTEFDSSVLNAYDYNSATSVEITGLDNNTWYVFNIWTYDQYGNASSAEEIAVKTNASINNDSLVFVNPESEGADSNIVIAGSGTDWVFRLRVTEINGWYAIASTTLHLADNSGVSSPFSDLAFRWDQTGDSFSEIGTDVNDAVTMTGSSTCAVNTCVLDFNLRFSKDFFDTSVDYSAEVFSSSDSGQYIHNTYTDFYQVRFPYLVQKHYRFRNDDGGE